MGRSRDGQQEQSQSGQQSTRWSLRGFTSAVWPPALAVLAVGAALQVTKSFYAPSSMRWLCDLGMIAAPLCGLATAAYLLGVQERRRALATILVMSALFVLALKGTDALAWRWERASAELPDSLGAVMVSTRVLDPPSVMKYSMPWNDHMWQVELRLARGVRRTVRLPDLLSIEPEMSVSLVRAGSVTALHLVLPTPMSDGEQDLYLDAMSGSRTEAIAGTEVPVGRFYTDDSGKLRFSPAS